jgi:hypothetical protein
MEKVNLLKVDTKEHFEVSMDDNKYYATHEYNTHGHDKWWVFSDMGVHESDVIFYSVVNLCGNKFKKINHIV